MVKGRYESNELSALAPLISKHSAGSAALDIGANIGNHAVFFANYFQEVHCFEPNPAVQQLLAANIRHTDRLVLHPFGLSDSNQTVEAFVPSGNKGGCSITRREGQRVRLHLKRFDDLHVTDLPISFIKIDVEGHESDVLSGMRQTLLAHCPLIAFECNNRSDEHNATRTLRTLRECGYSWFYTLTPHSRISQSLPAFFRWPARLCESAYLGLRGQRHTYPLDRFLCRDYPFVIASQVALW